MDVTPLTLGTCEPKKANFLLSLNTNRDGTWMGTAISIPIPERGTMGDIVVISFVIIV